MDIALTTAEPDVPDLVRMLVTRLIRSGIDYEDGGVILMDLYADAYGEAALDPAQALH